MDANAASNGATRRSRSYSTRVARHGSGRRVANIRANTTRSPLRSYADSDAAAHSAMRCALSPPHTPQLSTRQVTPARIGFGRAQRCRDLRVLRPVLRHSRVVQPQQPVEERGADRSATPQQDVENVLVHAERIRAGRARRAHRSLGRRARIRARRYRCRRSGCVPPAPNRDRVRRRADRPGRRCRCRRRAAHLRETLPHERRRPTDLSCRHRDTERSAAYRAGRCRRGDRAPHDDRPRREFHGACRGRSCRRAARRQARHRRGDCDPRHSRRDRSVPRARHRRLSHPPEDPEDPSR